MAGKGKGGGRGAAYQPRSQTLTASQQHALSRVTAKEERRAKRKETKRIVRKVKKDMGKTCDSSSSSDEDDDPASSSASGSSSDSDDRRKKKRSRKKAKKKEVKKKKKASSSECDESSSKGTSKSKKKKLSKTARLHQELQAVKEELAVRETEKMEFGKEMRDRFDKLEARTLEGKSVLHTPDKVRPLTKEDLMEAIADAGSKASEKAEASRPPKGILAWLNEVDSTPTSSTDPPEPTTTPSKQATKVSAVLREWLKVVADDPKKYIPLDGKNPTLTSPGNALCADIAKKVSSWFVNPADLALLVDLVKDFVMPTQATTPPTILKAILVALLSRGHDFNPEQLFVSRSDIMAIQKRGR